MTRPTGVNAVLVALSLGLAAVLAALWLAPGMPAAWRTWQAPAPQPLSLQDVEAALIKPNPAAGAAYPAVLERPVMEPTRKPAPPASAASDSAPPAPPPPPPNPLDGAKLQGIVAGPALNGILLERDGKTSIVRRGERVGDWTLLALQGRVAVFGHGSERRRVELPAPFEGGPDDAAAPAPAAAGARVPPSPPRPSGPPPRSTPSIVPPPAAPDAAEPPPPTDSFGGSVPKPR